MDHLIIDSFAGGGGASTGIENALGRSPDIAINHSASALALHEANHPETLHLNSNIWDIDPATVIDGQKIGLLWASPDCKHFSKAKGGAPKDRNIRDLAWVIVRWAKLPRAQRPDVILMENVEEFRTWGPICDEGRAIKGFEGITFDAWVKALRDLGYKIEWKDLKACDYGAPTIRKRLFMVARCDGNPIVWPKPTHGPLNSKEVKTGKLKPYRLSAECIDWSLPCPSVFDTRAEIKKKHNLNSVRPLAFNTMARVARGLKRYVIDAKRPFIVNLTHGARLEDTAAPLRTITGANRGEKAFVAPSITRFNGGATGQDMREPFPTVTANSWIKRPGGAAPIGLISPTLIRHFGSSTGQNVNAPAPTTTAGGGGKTGIVAPSLMSLKGTARRASAATAPHPTVLAGGGHSALISPILTYAQQGGQVRSPLDPMHTICASRKDQNAVFVPSLAQQDTVASWFTKYYGTGDGARADDPMHTITAKDRFGHVQADLSKAPIFGPEHERKARMVADLMREHGHWDDREFVTLTIDGETFVIVDVGMRMLTPRELFNAQGFPPDYVIEGVWSENKGEWNWNPFAKDVQISCVGNSVCPDIAEALVLSNCQHLIQTQKAA